MRSARPRFAIVWRGNAAERHSATPQGNRLRDVFSALGQLGADALPVIYSDEVVDEVREQLLSVDGVLVWVNPIADGQDRSRLDPLLRDVSSRGVWVSAHPDVILALGTKEVLFRTRDLGWGSDCHLYTNARELQEQLPQRLASGAARVLKQNRGNGGDGVWKVSWVRDGEAAPTAASLVEVLHAVRGSEPQQLSLASFLQRCEPYFGAGGKLIDQAFQERLPEGMTRCYMVHDRVIGFGHQLIKALVPPPVEGAASPAAQPGPRIMSGAANPVFQALRHNMESEWVPALQRRLRISREDLPVIWDADFLYGAKTAAGEDSYVLCEINVSCVFPVPDPAIPALAEAALARVQRARALRG
jgi:hypothetical protein